jgi:deoxyadenosine/deoxycytidine kinase
MNVNGVSGLDSHTRVIELVGPAGAGKTSLAEALEKGSGYYRTAAPPYFRNLTEMPFFSSNLVTFLPVLSRMMLDAKRRKPSPRQIVWMLTLQGWHNRMRESRDHGDRIILLDQGPIFIMTDLYRTRCINLQDRLIKTWWGGVIDHWAQTLDGVVLMDAPNKDLIERIRSRRKWHLMKERSDQDLITFLEDYRLWFERVLAQLSAKNSSLHVIRLNSARLNVSEMVAKTSVELGLTTSVEAYPGPDSSKQAYLSV